MAWVDDAIKTCPKVTPAQKKLLESTLDEMLELLFLRTRGHVGYDITGLIEEGCMEARMIIDNLVVE